MKLGVYTCMAPDLPAERLADILHEIGFRYVEWVIGYDKAIWDTTSQWHIRENCLNEDIPKFIDLCEKDELKIIGLGGAVSIFEPERLKTVFNASAKLSCPQVRIVSANYDGSVPYPEIFKNARKVLPEVIRIGKDTGVKPLLELHARTIIPSASAAARLLDGFDPKDIGIIFDPGNMLHEGYEQWQMGMEILGPYLAHVHIKNYGWYEKYAENGKKIWTLSSTTLGEGIANYSNIISALNKTGYQGTLSLEDFRGGYRCIPKGTTTKEILQEDFTYMKSILGEKIY